MPKNQQFFHVSNRASAVATGTLVLLVQQLLQSLDLYGNRPTLEFAPECLQSAGWYLPGLEAQVGHQ